MLWSSRDVCQGIPYSRDACPEAHTLVSQTKLVLHYSRLLRHFEATHNRITDEVLPCRGTHSSDE